MEYGGGCSEEGKLGAISPQKQVTKGSWRRENGGSFAGMLTLAHSPDPW